MTAPEFLAWLWRTSWQAAAVAVLVLAAQRILRDRLPAGWRHALWALVALRLILPVTPASPLSVFNLARLLRSTDAPQVSRPSPAPRPRGAAGRRRPRR
jgi:beta-lactamase regulating signal transducer with metallopeptidase domain